MASHLHPVLGFEFANAIQNLWTAGLEWSLAAGGISLDAWALLTGRTAVEASTAPTRTKTLTGSAGEHFPYVKIYGKTIGDDSLSDIHIKLWKCKVTAIEGQLQGDQFFVTSCSGIAIDDDTNGIWDIVQNETGDDLPTS